MTSNEIMLVLWDAALKGALLLALAGVTALALRRASAAVRHLVWSVAACGALLLPVLSFVLPEWRVPGIPDWRQPVLTATAAQEPPVRTPETLQPRRELPRKFVESPNVTSARETEAPVQPSALTINTRLVEPRRSSGLALWLPRVWLAGAIVAALPLMVGWLQVILLSRRSQPVRDLNWLEQLDAVSDKLHLSVRAPRRRVRLCISPHTRMPMTWGAWRAVLLLPAEAAAWSPARRRVVLLHELAHVKRFDWLTQTLAYLACALYWFNPLVWLAARRMRIEREQACDDLVLHCGSRPSDYAEELLKLAVGVSGQRLLNWAAVPMARRSSLEDRLRSILDDRRSRTALTGLAIIAALTLLAVIVVPMAMMKAGGDTDASKEARTEVAVWQALVDGATFNAFRAGHGAVEKTNAYRAEILDAPRVFGTLKSAQSNGGLMEFDEKMVWLKPTNPRFGGQQFLHLYSHRQWDVRGITRQTAGLQCIGHHEFTESEQQVRLDLELMPNAQFDQLKLDGSDSTSARSLQPQPAMKWKGIVEPGSALCFSAPLEGNTERELYHVVFVQAVSSTSELAAHLRGLTSTARWIEGGPEGALEVSREAKDWEARVEKSASAEAETVTLPAGMPIRVVAIGQPGQWPHRWWNLEGTPIKGNPAWQEHAGGSLFAVGFQQSGVEGGVSRAFRTPDDPSLNVTMSSAGSSEFSPATSVCYLSSDPPEKLQRYLDEGGRIDLVLQHGIGPWQEIGTIREGETVEADGGRFTLTKVVAKRARARRDPGLLLLDGRYDFNPAFDIAIVGVDKRGHHTSVGTAGGSGLFSRREDRRIYGFVQIGKEEVAHFAILKRPVQEFVFADLPTRDLKPLTARLPGDGPDEVANLSNRRVTAAALESLAGKPGLLRLDLSFSGMTDADLKYLTSLKQLRWLDLSQRRSTNGGGITDTGLTNLSALTQLETLQLHGHPITDAGLEPLKPLRQLEKLQLGGTRVTGSGLTNFPRLRWLRLDATPITDDDLRHLAKLTDLEQLYLDITSISDAGLVRLRSLKRLKSLNLHETRVTAAGVAVLKQTLRGLIVGLSVVATNVAQSASTTGIPQFTAAQAEAEKRDGSGPSSAPLVVNKVSTLPPHITNDEASASSSSRREEAPSEMKTEEAKAQFEETIFRFADLVRKYLPGYSLQEVTNSVPLGEGSTQAGTLTPVIVSPEGKQIARIMFSARSLTGATRPGDPSPYLSYPEIMKLLGPLRLRVSSAQEAEDITKLVIGLSDGAHLLETFVVKAEPLGQTWLATPTYREPTAQVWSQGPFELTLANGVLQEIRQRTPAFGYRRGVEDQTEGQKKAMDWGEPVEGVQVRLHAQRTNWGTQESPELLVDIANRGVSRFDCSTNTYHYSLEVDGRWYNSWVTEPMHIGGTSGPPPGQTLFDLLLRLNATWSLSEPTAMPDRLQLAPGKHIVRVKIWGWPDYASLFAGRHLFSNPLEIETSDQPDTDSSQREATPSSNPQSATANPAWTDPQSRESLVTSAATTVPSVAWPEQRVPKSPAAVLVELREILPDGWTCNLVNEQTGFQVADSTIELLFSVEFKNAEVTFAFSPSATPVHPCVRLCFLSASEATRALLQQASQARPLSILPFAETNDCLVAMMVTAEFKNNFTLVGPHLARSMAPLGRALESLWGRPANESVQNVLGLVGNAAGELIGPSGFAGQVLDDETGRPIKQFSIEFRPGPAHLMDGPFAVVIPPLTFFGGRFAFEGRATSRVGIVLEWNGIPSWQPRQVISGRVVADGYLPAPLTPEPVTWPVQLTNLVVRLKRASNSNPQSSENLVTSAVTKWGDPVEGVSLRLGEISRDWTKAFIFRIGVRNQRDDHIEVSILGPGTGLHRSTPDRGVIEVDGVWYAWTWPDRQHWPQFSGTEITNHDITIPVSPFNSGREDMERLLMVPGKRTVRLALLGKPSNTNGPRIHAISNPVEFEVSGQGTIGSNRPEETRTIASDPNRPFVVTGRVTDEQGNGMEGVTITAHCGMGTLRTTGETKSDAEGRYALRFREGMSIQRDGQWVVGVQAATISPRKAGFFETNLHRGGDLLMADKLPAPGEDVGWKVDPAQLVLPNQPYELNFVMRPAATLEGRLVDANNQPLADRKLYLTGDQLPPSSSVLGSATTDLDGRFRLEDVPTEFKWKFSATDAGKDVLSKEFIFREAIEHRIALCLQAQSAVDGPRLRATSYQLDKSFFDYFGSNAVRAMDRMVGRANALDDTPKVFLENLMEFSMRSHADPALPAEERMPVGISFEGFYRGETDFPFDLFVASALPVQLGPILEREIKRPTGLERSYLDLETGDLVTNAPPGDVTFLGGESDLRVRHGLNMVALPVATNRWDATAEEVVRELANQTNQAQVRLGGPESRRTWFFKTREGSAGVLQILPEENGEVRVRWRLVLAVDPNGSRRAEVPSVAEGIYERRSEELKAKVVATEAELNQILTNLNVDSYEAEKQFFVRKLTELKEDIFDAQRELAERKKLLENVTVTNTSDLSLAFERARIDSLIKRIEADNEIHTNLQAQVESLNQAGPRISELNRRRDDQSRLYEEYSKSLARAKAGPQQAKGDIARTNQPRSGFGPVLEGEQGNAIAAGPHYLDLDTGEFVTNQPPGDLSAHLPLIESDSRVRLGFSLVAVSVASNRWDATADEVVTALSNQTWQEQVRLGGPESRRTWFFKTREGSAGVLQILPEENGEVRVRWRLVLAVDPNGSRRAEVPSVAEEVHKRRSEELKAKVAATEAELNQILSDLNVVSYDVEKQFFVRKLTELKEDIFDAQRELIERKKLQENVAVTNTSALTVALERARIDGLSKRIEVDSEILTNLQARLESMNEAGPRIAELGRRRDEQMRLYEEYSFASEDSKARRREELRVKLAGTEAELNKILTNLNVGDYELETQVYAQKIAGLKEDIFDAQRELAERKQVLGTEGAPATDINIASERAKIDGLNKRIEMDSEILTNLQARARPLFDSGPRIAELKRRRDEYRAEYERSGSSNPSATNR